MTIKIQRPFAAVVFLVLLSAPVLAQSLNSEPAPAASADTTPATAPPTFAIADVHASPHSSNPFMTGGSLRGDHYIVHKATMVDLISLAYGMTNDNVLSGPAWLDTDRFDILAQAPRTTSPEDVKLMLRALLADRFKLVAHNDTKPVPSYVLRVDKGGPKLKQAAEAEAPNIEEHHTPNNLPPGVPAYYSVTCHNQTMAQFKQMLMNFATAYLPKPVIDETGLTGGYDFELHWTWQPVPMASPSSKPSTSNSGSNSLSKNIPRLSSSSTA